MKILVLNAGSSSQKSCLYDLTELPPSPPTPLWEAQIDWSHQPGIAELKVKTDRGETKSQFRSESQAADTQQMLNTLWSGDTQVIDQPSAIDLVGHRVVHGGEEYKTSTLITPEVKAAIDQLSLLAPVHNPVNLAGIEAIEQILGDVPQVAVFDTAFHSQMPPAAATYPIPYALVETGIRRYGFHGTSHQYCAHRAATLLEIAPQPLRDHPLKDLRLINCHLGNGCSLAAIRNGRSIDTTMGFTPLDGLVMGSRSGSIDPSILIYLMRHESYSPDQLETMLNKESGLKGISGVSGDMRQIVSAIDQGNDRARLALDIYIHRLRSEIGAMLASLAGLDALIFTAGVGENDASVRAAACEAFAFMGLKLDVEKNRTRSTHDRDIAAADSTVRVLVIHTEEDWTIAQECWNLYHSRRANASKI